MKEGRKEEMKGERKGGRKKGRRGMEEDGYETIRK